MSYIISYVGAGGKTSSIYQDAAAFVNEGKKVMITTTTHMYVPKDRVFIDGRGKSCEKLRGEVAGILKKNGICVCGTILSDNKKTEIYAVGKCAGNDAVEEQQKMEPEKFKTLSIKQLTAVCKEADVVLIEADGAAHKAAKAPEAWEPAVYAQSNKVGIVMGLYAGGGSVDEVYCVQIQWCRGTVCGIHESYLLSWLCVHCWDVDVKVVLTFFMCKTGRATKK